MPARKSFLVRAAALLVAATVVVLCSEGAQPQPVPAPNPNPNPNPNPGVLPYYSNRTVGGISINPTGMLDNPTVEALGELQKLRAKALAPAAGELNRTVGLRKISLRKLEAAMQKCLDSGKDLPNEMKCLAGLQQIRYVFVYPEKHDIVLAGPGEGWKVDAKGNIVGVTTGRPVLMLDDLLVALRTARGPKPQDITCSIDPKPDGLTQLREHVARLRTIGNPKQTAAGIERALGRQQITFTGVPADTHFARVLLAADYRMKRLAMNFDPAPIPGLPNFLEMLEVASHGMNNVLPRWWLAPEFRPLVRDADGLAWELRGATVKALTEDDFLTAAGQREHSGRSSPTAQKWADNMTREYDRLALAEPVFGELRNCAELAALATLIVRENLTDKAGYTMPLLLSASALKTAQLSVPKQVDSRASLLKRDRNWIISVSGGVMIKLHTLLNNIETSEKLTPIRNEAALGEHNDWWWN